MSYPFVATFAAADAAAVCALQTRVGAGALILNGTQVSYANPNAANTAQVVFVNVGRPLTYTVSGADLSGVTIVATGFDLQGNALTSSRAGPNNGTVATTELFHIVTGITTSATIGTAMSVGSATTGVTAWFLPDAFAVPTDISVYAVATATISYTIQQTPDNPNEVASPATFNDLNLTAVTATGSTNYGAPCGGVRGLINSSSGSGALKLTITQAR